MSEKSIKIKNAKTHNLKGIDVEIPHNKFVVVSGVSGSGKSSLAFDTLYAEGQRRYVESLSAYVRQFLGRMNKPEVDYITGLPPSIAIEQKVISNNPRSTVGTTTEIYEYLKLLFARVGKTISPISNSEVKRDNINDITLFIEQLPKDTEVYLMSPIILPNGREMNDHLQILSQQGFNRIFANNKAIRISDYIDNKMSYKTVLLLIDRVKNDGTTETKNRIADSLQVALYEGNNRCEIAYFIDNKILRKKFSKAFEKDGITFSPPTPEMFSFNNPMGACTKCEGFGKTIDIAEDLVVPDKSLSIYEDAIVCWKSDASKDWKNALIYSAEKFKFPIHKPYCKLTDKQISLLWHGNEYFGGIYQYFDFVKSQQYKIQYRVLLSRYRGVTVCPECNGTRLKKEANYVKLTFLQK